MGSASSVEAPGVDSKLLREELVARMAEGMTDQQLLIHMTAVYKKMVGDPPVTATPPPETPVARPASPPQLLGSQSTPVLTPQQRNSLSRDYAKPWSQSDGAASPGSRARRRRSVQGTPKQAQSPTQKSASDVIVAEEQEKEMRPLSPGQAETALVNTDCWESVNQQPVCLVCCMAFTSEVKLQNHVKYSSLHASNMPEGPPEEKPAVQEIPLPKLPPVLIYSGSKLFWRKNCDVQIFLLHHQNIGVIEVLGFSEDAKPLGRLWVNFSAVSAVLDTRAMNSDMDRITANARKHSLIVSRESLEADWRRKAVVTDILYRVGLAEHTVEGGTSTCSIELTQQGTIGEGSSGSAEISCAEPAAGAFIDTSEALRVTLEDKNASIAAIEDALADLDTEKRELVMARRASACASEKAASAIKEVARRGSLSAAANQELWAGDAFSQQSGSKELSGESSGKDLSKDLQIAATGVEPTTPSIEKGNEVTSTAG